MNSTDTIPKPRRPFAPEETDHPRLWGVFKDISAIPRLSGNEAGVRAYLTKWAVARFPGARVTPDDHGNISVRIDGKGKRKNAPEFLLQSHMDMVGIKEKEHNFDTDGITLLTDGENVYGDRTTLGADNLSGVASMVVFAEELDADGDHGPLTLLFTAREETDNEPALNFDPATHGIERPIPYVVSMDGNTEGRVGIYCAGYQDLSASITLSEDASFNATGGKTYRLHVGNHPGGHSGLTAHENRASANRTLFQKIIPLLPPGSRLMPDLRGGEGKSAWPTKAEAYAWIPNGHDGAWIAQAHSYLTKIGLDGKALNVLRMERGFGVLRHDIHDRVVRMFQSLPDGAVEIAPHGQQASLSSNLGSISTAREVGTPSVLQMGIYVRGDAEDRLTQHGLAIQRVLQEAGAHVTAGPVVPGCFTPPDAPLIQAALAAAYETSGHLKPVHPIGGHCFVEVGAIRNKLAAMFPWVMPQATVLPPATIEHEHSTNERANIASARRMLKALRGTYDRLAIAA